MESGLDIPIEERDAREITHVGETLICPPNTAVFNPGFDVTPAHLITGYITEQGVWDKIARI
jgi:methylthioribose-1-phosphate isomerase